LSVCLCCASALCLSYRGECTPFRRRQARNCVYLKILLICNKPQSAHLKAPLSVDRQSNRYHLMAKQRHLTSSGLRSNARPAVTPHLPMPCRIAGWNPFSPHRATVFQTRGVRRRGLFALQRYCISVLLAWRVSCTRLTLAPATALLCNRQPLATGGAGVAPSVPVCISIGQQGIFKNSENGYPRRVVCR
jgi:hypothetical protein